MLGKRTVISLIILMILMCLLGGLTIAMPGLWSGRLSHWIVLPAIALMMTLLLGLVLMDGLFELDDTVFFRLKKSHIGIGIRKYLLWAFGLVCAVSFVFEAVQFFLSSSPVRWTDPLLILSGSLAGIVLHIIGSKWLMKKVEFELERWEDNVL
jgi:hypothetical protein